MKCRRAANLPKESFFNECRAHNPKFYSDIDYDSEGVVKNIFWSHASCQVNYAEFKDVITFDTTYRSIFYRMSLGCLSEATTIYRMPFFWFALIGDETEKTLEWVFRTFQRCMEGNDPICILTSILSLFVPTHILNQSVWCKSVC
jgi:hypothetical protein